MKRPMTVLIAALAAAALWSPASYAEQAKNRGKIVSTGEDGSVCYEADVEDDRAYIQKIEAAEKAGRLKDAFDGAAKPQSSGCWGESSEHLAAIIGRTYKQLGQEAEKAGRLYEAHKYFIYPFNRYIAPNYFRDRFEKTYSLADAHRTMLGYAKANADDYKVVEEAVRYFNIWQEEKPPQLKEVQGLSRRGGDRHLATEEKDFAARKYEAAYEDLRKAREWYQLMDDDQRVRDRAKLRGDVLLADGSYDAVAQAFRYSWEFASPKLESAVARASKLGDEAKRKGDLELASRFYGLSGEDAKQDAVNARQAKQHEQQERQKEQAEVARREKFKQEQKSLEEELGF